MNCTPDQTDFLDRIYKQDPQIQNNMFQASLALEMEYGVSPEDAQDLIINWMKNYEKRKQGRNRNSNTSIPEQRRENPEVSAYAIAK